MRFVKYYLLLAILILVSVVYLAYAEDCTFNVRILNNSVYKAFYTFRWVDHPFKQLQSWEVAGGELLPGEYIDLINPQKCGTYYIHWTIGGVSWDDAFTELEGNATVILMSNRGI